MPTPIFLNFRHTGAGGKFYLFLVTFLLAVYLAVWLWVLHANPDLVPGFLWYALTFGVPVTAVVLGVIIWKIRIERDGG